MPGTLRARGTEPREQRGASTELGMGAPAWGGAGKGAQAGAKEAQGGPRGSAQVPDRRGHVQSHKVSPQLPLNENLFICIPYLGVTICLKSWIENCGQSIAL